MVDFGKLIDGLAKQLPFGGSSAKGKAEAPERKGQSAPDSPAGQEPPAGDIEVGVVSDSFDGSQLDDFKKQLSMDGERLGELEARLFKVEKTADNVKKENEALKGRMDQMDARILDMLSVYEVVSNQINPFVGSSKVLSSTMESLHEEVTSLKNQVSTMGADLKILSRGRVDVSRLVRSSVSDADMKRRVDLTKLIRSAVQSKKTVRTKKGELEYGP